MHMVDGTLEYQVQSKISAPVEQQVGVLQVEVLNYSPLAQTTYKFTFCLFNIYFLQLVDWIQIGLTQLLQRVIFVPYFIPKITGEELFSHLHTSINSPRICSSLIIPSEENFKNGSFTKRLIKSTVVFCKLFEKF
ncbi:hypothetical protein BLOT_009157 [Blomia tropicalis]|nr:hypothetical protein BLOT_009157 [Blomia tropicalis]